MAEKCYHCFRPKETCYCKDILPFDTEIHFVFLMHPKEAYKQKTGTGRLASLSLKNSEILIGTDFTQNARLKELLTNENYLPLLLFPDETAFTAKSIKTTLNGSHKVPLIIIIDGTWFCAKKILRLSKPILESLPKISFSKTYISQFTFKTQPQDGYISTIESVYYLLNELKEEKLLSPKVSLDHIENLMILFNKMVNFQLDQEKLRIAQGLPDRYLESAKKRKKKV